MGKERHSYRFLEPNWSLLVFFWLCTIPGLHNIKQNKNNGYFHCFQRNLTFERNKWLVLHVATGLSIMFLSGKTYHLFMIMFMNRVRKE